MRILITGSSGQIGTNLALDLLERGNDVFGIDTRPNPWTQDFPTLIQDLGSPYHAFQKGIGHVEYPEKLDAVVHFAAHAKVHELVEEPDRALLNVTMTFNVLEFCRHNGLPLIFSSTREVYGDIHHYLTEESHADFAFTESPYSASKIAGEALVYAYARCYGLQYMVFRFSNVYGRYDNDIERMERVIPLFIRQINRREPLVIYGEDKSLDFTYVDDCIQGVVRGIEVLLGGTSANHTINLAFGQGNSLITMARHIGECLGATPELIIRPSRAGEVTRYIANIGKARAILDYQPQTPLDEGIPKAVSWCLDWWESHPDGGSEA